MLFVYDIFFVFGTDVMLTVAKSIDAPIKILFPRDWSTTPPEFSLLGLGDIVLPGVFIALCLRYDVLRSLDARETNRLMEEGNQEDVVKMMVKAKATCSKSYFLCALAGYFVAIIATVVVMFVFDHGQPALLYLVPGCLGAVTLNALRLGDFKTIWEFDEQALMQEKKSA